MHPARASACTLSFHSLTTTSVAPLAMSVHAHPAGSIAPPEPPSLTLPATTERKYSPEPFEPYTDEPPLDPHELDEGGILLQQRHVIQGPYRSLVPLTPACDSRAHRPRRTSRSSLVVDPSTTSYIVADQRRAGRTYGVARRARYRAGRDAGAHGGCAETARTCRPRGEGKRCVACVLDRRTCGAHSAPGSTVTIGLLILVLLILIVVFKT